MLRVVPFNPAWVQHDKLDLKAIYRRPQWKDDVYGEPVRVLEHGLPAWDLTTPLPVKQHNKYLSKGFEYVTLADAGSLNDAAKKGVLLDEHGQRVPAREFSQDPRTGGPWNYRKYAEGQALAVDTELQQIRAAVAQYGSEAYEGVRRLSEPGFVLPEWLTGFAAGDEIPLGPKKAAPPAPAQRVAPDSEMTGRNSPNPPPRRRRPAPKKEEAAK